MADEQLRDILQQVAAGDLTAAEALNRLAHFSFEDIGFAKVDHHRRLRCGFPEVIFCPGKTPEQIVEIARRLSAKGHTVLASRADAVAAKAVAEVYPDCRYNPIGRTVVIPGTEPVPTLPGTVAVVCAGTSDLPVAEEARETAEALGCTVRSLSDVGVAGIHRLLAHQKELREASVVVAIAGMEGALPSVVSGLVDVPVIAVPTSVGYGAHLGGFAPLLTMLNSCASGVVVVNIDNGFGAAYNAALVCRAAARLAQGE
ncbi:MAG: nickel pincer cofactor biosynthesis protein LarB [Planctomycetes bacterium]|nr:nickel pincer cofactor biosynthesis protein LarB [Planctomycetota bacterium]